MRRTDASSAARVARANCSPLLSECTEPGCSTLTMGGTCVEHDPPVYDPPVYVDGNPDVSAGVRDDLRCEPEAAPQS